MALYDRSEYAPFVIDSEKKKKHMDAFGGCFIPSGNPYSCSINSEVLLVK